MDENKNSNEHTIKIFLESSASTLIVCKVILHEHHRTLKDRNNKWSTMAGTFNTTFIIELKLKLPYLNDFADIYAKFHLVNKLVNYNLILGRDILHELGIIFNFKSKIVNIKL